MCIYSFVSPQVCGVLESLEQEYRRDEDWCGGGERQGSRGQPEHLIPLINKHMEQKEAFLKVQREREREREREDRKREERKTERGQKDEARTERQRYDRKMDRGQKDG